MLVHSRTFALSLLLALGPLAVHAQNTKVFEGVWSGYITTQENKFWEVEDYACFVGCPKLSYDYLKQLLDNPANDKKPLNALIGESRQFMIDYLRQHSTAKGIALMESNTEANDTNLECHPYDFVRAATNPLPLKITRSGNELTIEYEEWNRQRKVFLDGRKFPDKLPKTSLGYSVGRMENGQLVIETRGLLASTYAPIILNAPGGHSDSLTALERYRVTAGKPTVLTLEVTLTDPVTLTEPYVYTKRWIATPEVKLLTDSCQDRPGVF